VPGQHMPVADGRGGVQRGGRAERCGRPMAHRERRHQRMARRLLAGRTDVGRAARQWHTVRAFCTTVGQGAF